MNNGQSNGRGPKSLSVDFYEPVVVSAGAFVLLIIIDLVNKNSSLVPIHSAFGVILTVIALMLCRNNNMGAAWVIAAIGAFFLLVTFWVALNQNQSVIDFKAWIAGSVKKLKKDVIWALTELDENVTNTFNSVSNNLAWLEKKATGTVDSWNQYGTDTSKYLTDKYNNATFNDKNWLKTYNDLIATGNVSPSTAVTMATSTNGAPPLGTEARKIADDVISKAPAVVPGEYEYICVGGSDSSTPTVAPGMSETCIRCSAATITNKDKCIAEAVRPPPLACLGALASTKVAPTTEQRDNCMKCTTLKGPDGKNANTKDIEDCRTARIASKPWPPVISEFTNFTGSLAGTLGGSAAADPVAGTAAPFTNYMGGFRW